MGVSEADKWALETIAKADMRFASWHNPHVPVLHRLGSTSEIDANGVRRIVDIYNPPPEKTWD